MSVVSYINNLNGPFLVLNNDNCLRWGADIVDLINQDQNVFHRILQVIKPLRPDKKVVLDCGSNIGTFSIPLAKAHPDLKFIGFEIQKMIYYCFCGTVALQNATNVFPNLKGIGDKPHKLQIKIPDYAMPGNYGAFEAKKPFKNTHIADMQYINNYDIVDIITIDSLLVDPIMIKFDIEGMELLALAGAEQTIDLHEPLIYLERLKSDDTAILNFFANKPYTMRIASDNEFFFIPNRLLPTLQAANIFQ